MIFSSVTFLFVFLPLVLFFYYISAENIKNYVLLFFSFAFYAWGEPKAFFIMLSIIIINYFFALLIQCGGKCSALFLIIDLLLCFSFLFYFKYFDFAIRIFDRVSRKNIPLFNIALPIGISFYIFQAVSYTIDVFRKECSTQKNPLKLALYISFFPQLIAGPIVKYHEIEKQLDTRKISLPSFASGTRRFIYGLAKKTLIANTAATVADSIFFDAMGSDIPSLWIGAFAYSLQIYFDFSGYSDMALGLGKMFGFSFPENFNYPYISSSITEFWRRWHISLSTWFKEYVYIPLGGNRVSKARTVLNIFIVFLLTGLWHGAAWTFVAWGLYHGFFNIIEKITGFDRKSKKLPIKIIKHLYLLFVVMLGWVIFRSQSIMEAKNYIFRMFGFNKGMTLYSAFHFISAYSIFILIIGCIFSFPLFPLLKKKAVDTCLGKEKITFIFTLGQNILCLFLLLMSAMNLASGTYNPFIYFRF